MKTLSRREFLKVAALGVGSLGLSRAPAGLRPFALPEFPRAERLGRVIGGKVPVKARPDIDSPDVGVLFDDDVVPWLREVVGSRPLWYSQTFVETPQGYIYAPNLQPVRNQPNEPLTSLPSPEGFWAEVTVPYVDLTLHNPPHRSPWLNHTAAPRLYYSQIMWIDDIRTTEDGQVLYRVNERYGTFGDIFWAAGEAFRPL
ncbi:MAG: twin-arginine translocation signal domain-containing protein, partial [Chloroflexi bacterium]|nr:twin-arginine translocation signal domain-containing protein [Chloroflexota bacterium]